MMVPIEHKKIDAVKRFLIVSISAFLAIAEITSAQNSFDMKIESETQAHLELNNCDAIAGIQFVLHSPNSISLTSLQKESRLADGSWIMSSSAINDTTISVLAINLNLDPLLPGSGFIVKINLVKNSSSILNDIRFILSDIILCDKNGLAVNSNTQEVINVHFSDTKNDYALIQNFPNPFNPQTTINYKLESSTHVRLIIYDIMGRIVKTLCDEEQPAGNYNVVWNSVSDRDEEVASGTYFCQLQTGSNITVIKLQLEK